MRIVVDGFVAKNGALSPEWMADNERRFAFVSRCMREGMTEAEGVAKYEATYSPEQRGQANCRTCGKWNCDGPHED